MNVKLDNGGDGFSTNWVVGRLRVLASVEPPAALKDKLMAGIPASAGARPAQRRIRSWSRGMQWTSAAAVVAITASLVAWLGFPSGPHARLAIEANNSPGHAYPADYNSLRPSDSNLYDTNNLR